MKENNKYINIFLQPEQLGTNILNLLSNYYYDKALIRKKTEGSAFALLENQNIITKIRIVAAAKKCLGFDIKKINYKFKHKQNHLCGFQAPFIKNFFQNKNNFLEQKNTLKMLTSKKKKYLSHFRSVKGGYLCFAGGIFGFLPKTQSMRLISLRNRRKNIIYENALRHEIRLKSRIFFYAKFIKKSFKYKTKNTIAKFFRNISRPSKNVKKNKLKGKIKQKIYQMLSKNIKKPLKKLAEYKEKLQQSRNLRVLRRKEKLISYAFNCLINWYKFTIIKSTIKPVLKIKKYRRRRKIQYVRYKIRRIKRKNIAYKKYVNCVFLCNNKFYYYNKHKKKLVVIKKKTYNPKKSRAKINKIPLNNQNKIKQTYTDKNKKNENKNDQEKS
jgi:hypothetical protein